MKEKDITELLERYEQMLVSGKNMYFDADEFDELADYYDKTDDIESAREAIELGLKIHPNNELLILRQIRFYIYDAEYSKAFEYLSTHFNSYNFDSHLLKIECMLQLGLFAEAHELAVEVLSDDDTEKETALSELGFLYVEAEYFDEAILYFEKSLEYDPDNKDVLNDLAYAYESKGDFTEAVRVCERILDLDPYAFDTWLTLGKLYSLDEDYEKAVDAFDFALTLDEGNVNVLKLKIHCLILSDRTPEAIYILKQALEMVPDDKLLYLTLIDCYLELEELDNMLEVITQIEARFGDVPESLVKKAYVFFMKDNPTEAESIINRILDKNPDSADICTLVGNLYYNVGEMQKSEDAYQKALALDDGYNEDIFHKLVVVHLNQNDIPGAIEYQKKIVEITESSTSKIKLALLYMESSNKTEFQKYVNSLDDTQLSSLLTIFYPEEQINLSNIDRNYILVRLDDVFESRLLYKNIKY